LSERFNHITSEHIIAEADYKLRLPRIGGEYRLTDSDIIRTIALLRGSTIVVPISLHDILPVTGDPEDDTVLATCRLGSAEYLVTGDRGLLAMGVYEATRIVTPREFLNAL
jgi:putative PIN family toxin of toxin-antitoxin system